MFYSFNIYATLYLGAFLLSELFPKVLPFLQSLVSGGLGLAVQLNNFLSQVVNDSFEVGVFLPNSQHFSVELLVLLLDQSRPAFNCRGCFGIFRSQIFVLLIKALSFDGESFNVCSEGTDLKLER